METPPQKYSPRVYLLTPSFPPTLGGQENHLLELAHGLNAAGMAVRVFTRRVAPHYPATELLGSVAVRRLTPFGAIKGVGFRAAPRLGVLLVKMLWRLLRDTRDYDVVLVSGFNFMPLAPVIAGLVTRKPCVVRPESPLEVTESVGSDSRAKMHLSERSLVVRLWTALRRGAGRRVTRYVAISSEIAANLQRVGIDAKRIVAIPNGIAVERFVPASAARKAQLRATLGMPADSLLLIYTGRLAATKGIMMLIEAWRELAPVFPAGHLVIVGTGHGSFDDCEPDLVKFIAAHDLGARVTMTGSVGNVHEYLQAADVFVFPSDYEGFSLSILEAMSAGLPMVTTRVGIAAELEHGCRFGLLVPPKDAPQFREALRTLLSDAPLRAAMGSAAHQAVRDRYSLQAEARCYGELFTSLSAPS